MLQRGKQLCYNKPYDVAAKGEQRNAKELYYGTGSGNDKLPVRFV